jgi:hypothetical protein
LFPPTLVLSRPSCSGSQSTPAHFPSTHHSRSSSRPANNTPNLKLQAPDHASHHHLFFCLLESFKSAVRETNYRQASGAPSLPSNTTNLTGAQTLAVHPPIGQIYLYCRLHSALTSVLILVSRAPTSLSSRKLASHDRHFSPENTTYTTNAPLPSAQRGHTPQPCQTPSRRRP